MVFKKKIEEDSITEIEKYVCFIRGKKRLASVDVVCLPNQRKAR